jgi:hypothetical protein
VIRGSVVLAALATYVFVLLRPPGAPAPPLAPRDTAVDVLPSDATAPGCISGSSGEWPDPARTLGNGTVQAVTYHGPSRTTGTDALCYPEGKAIGGTAYSYNWTVSHYCIHAQEGAPTAPSLAYRPASSHIPSLGVAEGIAGGAWTSPASMADGDRSSR